MIEEVITNIISRTLPSTGSNLDGFEIDCTAYFGSEFAREARVQSTGDPRELLRVKVVLSDDIASIQDASQALRHAWESVAYNHFEAASIHWFREAIVLRFVTVISRDAFFVTGTVIASSPGYSKLVEAYDQDFADLSGPLPNMPGGVPQWALGRS